ncbi:hypothetical protein [Streptomyces hainanensis]|uniref:Extracellular solute-binding protein n=1 Tax=Streptomyces hainanensis TaxID=402648 RepID=A0A4V2Y3V4_9ACTN|nr:hypothetical protein [Streptomyces hainanensis]TDC77925.1 hypothetical protein E1283_06195 [Streptomyces hainanensis]
MTQLSRRTFLGGLGTTLGAVALAGPLTACGGGGGASRGTAAFDIPTFGEPRPPALDPAFTASHEAMRDVYVGQPAEYFRGYDGTPLSGGEISTFQLTWGNPPSDVSGDPYWQELNRRLGGTIDTTFVPAAQYGDKLATTLASGSVPDLVFVDDNSPVALQGIRDGAFADLSETLSGDNVLEWPHLAARREDVWRSSLRDGRIVTIPSPVHPLSFFPLLRLDIVEQVGGNAEPADADELFELLAQVAAVRDAHGLPVHGIALYDDPLQTVVEAMYRVGCDWQLDGSGGFVHKIETEAYRESLAFLARCWEAGVFNPDALSGTVPEGPFGNAVFAPSAWSNSVGGPGIHTAERDTEGIRLGFLELRGFDGGDCVWERNLPHGRSIAVSSRAAEDTDRLREILNVLDYLSAPWGSEERLFIDSGIEGEHWEMRDGVVTPTNPPSTQYTWVASGDAVYNLAALSEPWAEGFHAVASRQAEQSVPKDTLGLTSETLASRGVQLNASLLDQQNAVVSGRASLSDFDDFVRTWLDQGGEQIRREYDEAREARG